MALPGAIFPKQIPANTDFTEVLKDISSTCVVINFHLKHSIPQLSGIKKITKTIAPNVLGCEIQKITCSFNWGIIASRL